MAVGKAGSFATVQPAIVDFGGMAQGAFDKIRADEERKRKENEVLAEKKRQEIDKVGSLGFIPSTNVQAFNEGYARAYKENLKPLFANARNSGDTYTMKNLQDQVLAEADAINKFNKGYEFISKNKDSYNEVYYANATNILDSLNSFNINVGYREDGKVVFDVFKDEEKTIPFFTKKAVNEIGDEVFNIPPKFEFLKEAQSFVKTYKPDIEQKVNEGKKIITKEVFFDDEKINRAIDGTASRLSTNISSLADWWVSQNPDKELKTKWSNEEKQEAKEFYKVQLKDALYNEYKEQAFNRGRGGDKEKKINLTNVVNGVVTTTGGDVPVLEVGVMFGSGSRSLGVSLGNQTITNIAYDPSSPANAPRLWFRTATSGSEGQGISGRTQGGEGASTRLGQASSVRSDVSLSTTEGKRLLSEILTSLNDPSVRNAQDLVNKYFGGGQSNQTTTQTNSVPLQTRIKDY